VERDGGGPEPESRHHEHHRDQRELTLRHAGDVPGQVRERLQVRHARHAVEVGEAEEQQARREDAQEEILGGRLLRGGRPAGQVEQQVGRHAHELEADEQEGQLVRRGHQHRAGRDEEERAEELGGT